MFAIRFMIVASAIISCKPDVYDDPIPIVPFADIVKDLNNPDLTAIKSDGGVVYLNEGGVRGLILYRKSSLTYFALERNCSFHPNEVCSTVNIDASNLFLICSCCSSTFNLEGSPTGAPAYRPLRQYRTFINGSTLTITSESINGM